MRLIESSTKNLSKKSPTCLEGEFAILDSKNQNGRIYPREVYESALRDILPKVESRSLLGECDHPLTYDEVRLSNVSHVITELHVEDTSDGRKVFGSVELLDTPAGKIVQSLVEAGVPIGISSRAVGDSVEHDGYEEVTSLNLITYDLVADPSFKNAVLSESARSKLGESLSVIEKNLPLRESRSYSPVKGMIRSIRESLLVDTKSSAKKVSINPVYAVEVATLRDLVESKCTIIKDLRSKNSMLASSIKESARVSKDLRNQISDARVRLTRLRSNMSKLQDAYNEVAETTVSQSDYDKLLAENLELRKKLLVESRGMTYSQVRDFLEGATTDDEINARLDNVSKHKRPTSTVVRDLREVLDTSSKDTDGSDSLDSRRKQTTLSTIISRV